MLMSLPKDHLVTNNRFPIGWKYKFREHLEGQNIFNIVWYDRIPSTAAYSICLNLIHKHGLVRKGSILEHKTSTYYDVHEEKVKKQLR